MNHEGLEAVVTKQNEQGEITEELLQNFIMKDILGVDELPKGFKVGFLNGDTLDCRRANLVLVPVDSEIQ